MEKVFFLKEVIFDSNQEDFLFVLLEDTESYEITKWEVSEELMDFSMDNLIKIPEDMGINILVYTKRYKDGTIKPTIKAFYKGSQENLLLSKKDWKNLKIV